MEGKAMLVRIGNSKDITAGQMRVFNIAGTKVDVANADGHLYAFDDTCTHTGCSLAMGKLDGKTVTCHCHGSQFDVTSGAVIRGPATRPVRSRLVQVEGEALLAEA
ncbi:MAG: (2Fe-2S)-binding protein [Gemmatimonadetes bacterium]|nr:MAG: (2Fe-2S)-binding protein [Gemmatimonadota bacterium]